MKSKVFAIFFLLCGILSKPFCAGVGMAGLCDFSNDFAAGGSIDFQPDGIPFIFEGEALFCKDGAKSLCGGVEFLAGNIHLFKAMNFFYAPELSAGWDFCDQAVILGNAIFVGFNGFVLPHLELFGQAGWRPEILFTRGSVDLRLVNFPVRFGLRFWTE